MSSDWDVVWMWEEQRPTANYAAVASQAMVEPMWEDKEEVDEEADVGEGSSTGNLEPTQALVLLATMLAAPGFWAVGPSDQVGRRGAATSLKAWVKAPTV